MHLPLHLGHLRSYFDLCVVVVSIVVIAMLLAFVITALAPFAHGMSLLAVIVIAAVLIFAAFSALSLLLNFVY